MLAVVERNCSYIIVSVLGVHLAISSDARVSTVRHYQLLLLNNIASRFTLLALHQIVLKNGVIGLRIAAKTRTVSLALIVVAVGSDLYCVLPRKSYVVRILLLKVLNLRLGLLLLNNTS